MRVLIVDDDPLMRELASFSLSIDPEFEVREADSGAAAIALLETSGWMPDVILLDMKMPGIDGAMTLAHLPRGPRIVVMTATPDEAEPLLARGAIDVIAKPIDPASFADRVRSATSRR
ncbi:MAG TPA: response regulator [Sphingomonas sp.]|jgi:CheY-like chemotaxis protein|nr:response regulator [Sphingomonas sp.]